MGRQGEGNAAEMIRVSVTTLIVALIGQPALAQTTTCTPFGISVQCETSPSGADTFARGMATLGNAMRARQDKQKAAIAFHQALADGDCRLAGAIAQAYGDANDVRHVAQNCQSKEARAFFERQQAENAQADLKERVARLTLLGRCDEAKAAALQGSSLDMADQVMRVCTPQPITAGESPTHVAR